MTTEFKILQMCSGHLLGENYPDNWESLSEEDQREFISSHEWEFMEGADEDWMIDQIENLAYATQKFINENYAPKSKLEAAENEILDLKAKLRISRRLRRKGK